MIAWLFLVAGAADSDRGRELYVRCQGCHSMTVDRTGPRHCGLIGRRAGTVPGFSYSEAMKASGIVWTAETLDTFLRSPTEVVPGTKMPFAGIPDGAERRDLVAWIAAANRDPGTCPPEE